MHEWKSALHARLDPLRLPAEREAAVIEELAQHLEDRRAELVAGGLDHAAATAATLAELSRADLLAPRLAAVHHPSPPEPPSPGRHRPGPLGARGGPHAAFAGLWQDLRYALRALLRQPGFSLVAVITLAFGIGLNTAMFSFLNTLLLRPLPFPDATALTRLYRTTPQNQYGSFSPADYLAMQQEAAGFGRFAAYQPASVTITDPGQSGDWYVTSASLFDIIGLPPALGRTFTAADELSGSHRVVVISYAFWQNRFGGAANVIGQTIRGNDEAYEIIGVLSAEAGDQRLLGNVGLFSPLTLTAADRSMRAIQTLTILARRAPTVAPAQGEAFVRALGARLAADFPLENRQTAWRTEPLPQSATGRTGRNIVAMLVGLSSFVLLIACSNLANLLLARTMDRSRELAVRAALGASRAQMIRALVLESALLAAAGGLGALAVATWTTGWLRTTILTSGGPAFAFAMDWRVLAFTLAASLLTLLCCALAPTLFAGRVRTGETLRSGGRGSTVSRRQVRLRYALITTQFALAMTLLAGSGYFMRGAANLLEEHFGWNADHVIQGEIVLPESTYPKPSDIVGFQQAIIDRVQRLPGVEAASVSYGMPYTGLRGFGRYVAQTAAAAGGAGVAGDSAPDGATLGALVNAVTHSYFNVTRTRLLAGRFFDARDTAAAPAVVIVSESMARALFPTGSPIGRRVRPATSGPPEWMEIVGVVQDVRPIDVAQEPNPFQLYLSTLQDPRNRFTLAARTTGAPGLLAPAIRAAITSLDPKLETRRLMSATARMQDVTASMMMVQHLLTAFAALGLLLAALGIYGAMTRMVAQRTDEIGLRMALGAQARDVVALVLGVGGRIVGIGAAIGILGALGLSRILGSVLPGLRADVWLVGAAATALLLTIALVACYRPTRRATAIDPMTALRAD